MPDRATRSNASKLIQRSLIGGITIQASRAQPIDSIRYPLKVTWILLEPLPRSHEAELIVPQPIKLTVDVAEHRAVLRSVQPFPG